MNLKGLTQAQSEYLQNWLDGGLDEYNSNRSRLMSLLEASVGRIAANGVRRVNALNAPNVNELSRAFGICVEVAACLPRHTQYRHILDWFESSLLENAGWLQNTDAEGRPKKLLKCSTYNDLMREADKAMDRRNAQMAKALGPADERPVADLADGFRLVRLLTPAALDLESKRMHHCVGHGSYDEAVKSGDTEIYSLRDVAGRPVLTVEIDRYGWGRSGEMPEIEQIQGKHNTLPDRVHLGILKPFAKEAGWRGRGEYWPYVTDVDGFEHDVDAIPPGTVLPELDLSMSKFDDIALPEGLEVRGDVHADFLSVLPEGLKIGGDLVVGLGFRSVSDAPPPLVVHVSVEVEGKISVAKRERVVVPDHLLEKVEVREMPKARIPRLAEMTSPIGVTLARFEVDAHNATEAAEMPTTPWSAAAAHIRIRQQIQELRNYQIAAALQADFTRAVLGEPWRELAETDDEPMPPPP